MRTLIIAEAGVNHNGDLQKAKELIDVAAEAGADYVKFQTFDAAKLVSMNTPLADYQRVNLIDFDSQFEMLSKLELTKEMHYELVSYCSGKGIGFFSTGFDTQSVDFLISLGQEILKIPSGEITNLPYIRHIGGMAKRVILSTGMSTMQEIESALNTLISYGTEKEKVTVLHCTSAYPAPMDEVNLLAMLAIKDHLKVNVGYSDHTLGIEVSVAAVALGATIIEKHFTLDKNLIGPDHKASLEPYELKNLVTSIRNIDVALGTSMKKPSQSEIENLKVIRKSIVASKEIRKGEVFTSLNLTTKRPGTGISPIRWDEVLGKVACRDFQTNEMIEL